MDSTAKENWHFAGLTANFEDEDVEQVKVGSLAIAVYRAKGQFYATQDLCTHERAFLSDGVVVDCIVECPFHQGRFDVRTGKAMGAPVIVPLKTYSVKVENERIYVVVSPDEAVADAETQARFGSSQRDLHRP
jgi:3-phenylpropionate/trans-cinnamate dioxygenase ferredoxin component